MAFTRLNIAALPPMPSASDSTATAVKPGLFQSTRAANRASCAEGLEAHEGPHVAALLFQGDGVPEPAHGRVAGFVGAQARGPVLLFAQGEMEAQLVVQVALELAAPEERLRAQPRRVDPLLDRHGLRRSP